MTLGRAGFVGLEVTAVGVPSQKKKRDYNSPRAPGRSFWYDIKSIHWMPDAIDTMHVHHNGTLFRVSFTTHYVATFGHKHHERRALYLSMEMTQFRRSVCAVGRVTVGAATMAP